MIEIISKASGQVLPISAVKFSHKDTRTDEHVYRLLMPITRVWQEFKIRGPWIAKKVLPGDICDLIDYYCALRPLMGRARDLKVLDEDLRPISHEEKQVFGVREGNSNPCFPNVFKGIDRSYVASWFQYNA